MIRSRFRLMLGLLLGISGTAAAAHAEDLPPIASEAVVEAPVQRVWAAFTTSEGLKSWLAPHAQIELRVGGKMLTNYKPDGAIGDPGTIENTILSFEPQRMLSLKATKAPANFPFENAIASMWTVSYFEPLPGDRTRVRVVGMGFASDEESRKMRDFFERGNALTLQKLQQKFAGGAAAPAAGSDPSEGILAQLASLTGDDWIVDTKRPDGGVFRSRSQWTHGPDGKSIVARGWLGDADGMMPHGASQIWREPPAAPGGPTRVRFQNIDENGSLSRGEIRLLDEKSTEWDWDLTGLSGRTARFHVLMRIESPDEYRLIISRLATDAAGGGSEKTEMVNVLFKRVREVPAEFLKLKPRPSEAAGR